MSETVCEMCNREGCPRKVLSLMSTPGPQWESTLQQAAAECYDHVVNWRDCYFKLHEKVQRAEVARLKHSLRIDTARGGDGFVHQACGHDCTGCDLREALAALVRP